MWELRRALRDAEAAGAIGALDRADGTCVFWHTAPAKTWDDLAEERSHRRLDRGGLPDGGLCGDAQPAVRGEDQGRRGYKAGSDIDLAMQRQEVDGRCGTHLKSIPALHPDWIRDNRLLVPIVVSEQRNKDYPRRPRSGNS